MLVNKLEQERPEEFAACYRAWVMASQARIQTMAELDEIPLAHNRAKEFKARHQAFGKDFLEVRRDPYRKLESEPAHVDPEAILKEIGQQSAGAHEIIKGRVLQLEYMVENKLDLNDLPAIPDGTSSSYAYICV
jgi:Tfp pilus assembly protein PilN